MDLVCKQCGDIFVGTNANNKCYCSKDCYKESNRSRSNSVQKSYNWKEYRQTPGSRYCQYRVSAKNRNISFTITLEDFMTFWKKPCSYCGSSISTIGLDRIDSEVGYDIDNIIPCCILCNKMKSNRTTDEFLEQVNKIHNFMK